MSTATKTSYARGLAEAESFREMFRGCYQRWEFAGSLRRKAAGVGDLEHVVIPAFDELNPDLWGKPQARANLVWRRLDELLAAGEVLQHVYGYRADGRRTPQIRWGERYRGADWRGITCEIFSADQDNWGSVLAIRTGPAHFSAWLQVRLHRAYRRNWRGYVWECRRCPPCEEHRSEHCPTCQGTGLEPLQRLPVPTEQEYFRLASGLVYLEPEERT